MKIRYTLCQCNEGMFEGKLFRFSRTHHTNKSSLFGEYAQIKSIADSTITAITCVSANACMYVCVCVCWRAKGRAAKSVDDKKK